MANITRPYLQRPYLPRYGGYGQQQTPFARGWQEGTSIGGSLGTLATAIANMQDKQRMDAIANQLMNTQNAPRAALVAPGRAQYDPVSDVIGEEGLSDQFQTQTPGQPNVIPQGVSTVGTQPARGGLDELKVRQAFQQQLLADKLRQAQIDNALAQAHGTGRYAPKPVVSGPSANQLAISERMAQNQAIKQAHLDQKANSDSVAKVYQDFDKVHGKGQAAEVYTAIGAGTGYRGSIVHDAQGNQHWVGDANGPLFTLDPRAAQNGPVDKDFQYYNMDELQSYYGRLQNIQQKGQGGVYTPTLRAQPAGVPGPVSAATPSPLATTDTTGTDTTGTDTTGTDTTDPFADLETSAGNGSSSANLAQANLPQPTSLADYNSIPTGSLFIDGDGLTKRKYTV